MDEDNAADAEHEIAEITAKIKERFRLIDLLVRETDPDADEKPAGRILDKVKCLGGLV